jgi:O-antigen/teichoic acid export membrane protein
VTTDEATLDQRRQENRKDSRAAAVYLAGRSVGMVLLLVTQIVANHVYDRLGFAYVAAVFLIYQTSIALGSLGLPDAVFYFIGRYPERASAIVRQTSALLLAAALVVIPIALGAAVLITQSDGKIDLLPALPWLAIVVLVELPTQPAVNQLIAHGYATVASILYAGFAALQTVAGLVPAMTGWSMTWIPVAMAVFGMTRLLAHLYILRRIYPMTPGQRWLVPAQMKEIFTFALPSGVAATVGKLNPQIDKYAVEFVLGSEMLAVYSAAAFELPLVTMIPYAIGAVMQVRYVRLFASGERDELRRLWYQTVEKTMILVVPLAVLIIVLAPDLISLAYEPQYIVATGPFQIFTLVLLHRVAAYGPMLQATGQQRLLFTSSVIIVVSNLALQYPMIQIVGLNGSAIATAFANVPAWLFVLQRIGVALGGGIAIALPWRFYLRTLVVAGALGGALHLAHRWLTFHPGINLAIGIAAYSIAFVIVGRLAGVLKPEDTAYLRRTLSFGILR